MASTYELLLMAQVSQLLPPVNATPVSTVTNGTTSVGTTETFDAVLGYYQCSLIAGRRYLATMNGLVGNGTSGDVYTLQIRDSGSASNPTASSTLIAMGEWAPAASGSAGRQSIPLAGSFIASSTGTHTFGMSSTRISGTGAFVPIGANAGTGTRELYVMYLGTV
jgi:hypothetical protein